MKDLLAHLLNAALSGADRLLPGSARREARRALLWAALDASAYPSSHTYASQLDRAADDWRKAIGYPGPAVLRWWRW